MDAVQAIQQSLDVTKLLHHYGFQQIREDNEFIRACCKLHGGNNPTSFVINKENGLWYCHSNCGGGDAFTLVQKMEGIEFIESVRWLASFFNVDINNLQIVERKAKYIEELRKFVTLVKSKRKKEIQEFNITEEIKPVTRYRNFNQATLEHFNLGYVDEVTLAKRNGEHYTLRARLVFPIYFQNIRVGMSFRRTKSTDVPKWSHQPAHIETKNLLYNYDSAKDADTIVVCEGITDVWAFYECGIPAVATFGAHLTQEQYKLLLRTGADIVLAYDGDSAGKLATQRAIKMLKWKANLSVIHFNENEDPESITREELYERYSIRTKC
jgi:DNA primase